METVISKLSEQGLLGLFLIITISVIIYFYHQIETINTELHLEVKELRNKVEKMYSEDRVELQIVIQKNTDALNKNSEVLTKMTFRLENDERNKRN